MRNIYFLKLLLEDFHKLMRIIYFLKLLLDDFYKLMRIIYFLKLLLSEFSYYIFEIVIIRSAITIMSKNNKK
jgi:hypothetical protein